MKKKRLNATALNEWRKDNGLSWARFAERVGVTRAAVSKWVLGKSFPSGIALVAISAITGIPLNKLTRED